MSLDQRRQKQDRQLRPRVVAAARQVYAGDVTPFDLTCIVPVLHRALEADGAAPTREQEDDERFDADFGVLNH
jgi:hypothetical protein